MKHDDSQLGRPGILYTDTKSNIEAISGAAEGSVAYATDTNEFGSFSGSTWTWGQSGGGEGTGDVVGPDSAVDGHLAVFDSTTGKLIKDGGAVPAAVSTDGWAADANTWTYSSADDPTYVASVDADMTGVLSPGMRVKLTQTTVRYFIVTAVGAYSGGATLITLYGGTDYNLDNAAISGTYYSAQNGPQGFPLDPNKWSLEVTDTSARTQSSPDSSTWYNLGSISISVPIGAWRLRYSGRLMIRHNASGWIAGLMTLSTANNSESDADFTTGFNPTLYYVSALGAVDANSTLTQEKYIAVASKTSYYLNEKSPNGLTSMSLKGDENKTIVRAECAYISGGATAPVDSATKYVTTEASSSLLNEIVLPQLASYHPDTPPASPGTYDDEFNDGSLSANWTAPSYDANFDMAQTNGNIHISETIYSGFLLLQGKFTLNGAYNLYKAFTPSISQAFSIVTKVHSEITKSDDQCGFLIGIRGANDGEYYEVRAPNFYGTYGARGVWTGGASVYTFNADLSNGFYILISHDGSKNFQSFISLTGLTWVPIHAAQAVSINSFTRLGIGSYPVTAGRNPFAAVDFIRYFTTAQQYKIGKSI